MATAGDNEDKTELLRSARECFKQAIKLANMLGYDNDGLIDHALELVAAIDAIVPPSDADDEEDEITTTTVPNEPEWDDIASEDEDVEMGS
ncbi:hypothetical protein GGI24_003050 [Coemansia furcata]|nr:hypothetical protein GGI24_003050 [Coemansia furcata]